MKYYVDFQEERKMSHSEEYLDGFQVKFTYLFIIIIVVII